MMDWILSHLNEFFTDCWDWFMSLFYWFTCIGSIILLGVYAGTKDRKPLNIMVTLLIVWIFLEGISSI